MMRVPLLHFSDKADGVRIQMNGQRERARERERAERAKKVDALESRSANWRSVGLEGH